MLDKTGKNYTNVKFPKVNVDFTLFSQFDDWSQTEDDKFYKVDTNLTSNEFTIEENDFELQNNQKMKFKDKKFNLKFPLGEIIYEQNNDPAIKKVLENINLNK